MRIPPGAGALAAGAVARVLSLTWRWRLALPEGDDAGGGGWRRVRPPVPLEPRIYALWHEHLLPLAVLHRGQGAVALVSRHRDGEILARVLGGLGYGAARGSSTRGGGSGLREMIRAGRSGRTLAFTPDGPRGPARTCKPGVVRAARATGLPVVPAAAAASTGRRLRSWDGFLVPAPAATVYVAHGPPVVVDGRPQAGPGGRAGPGPEPWCRRLERAVEEQRRRCEAAARAGGGG